MSCTTFPRIPKCAGASIRKQLLEAGIKLFLDHDHPPHRMPFFAAGCQRRNRECELLDFNAVDMVFGHFPARRYRRPRYRLVLLLREPLQRALSQYSYWKNILPATNLLALHRNPVIRGIKAGTLGFAEFAKTIHTYRLYLDGMKPEDFHLVGFLDRYPQSLAHCSELLGVSLAPVVRERESPPECFPDRELAQAAEALHQETAIYESFRNRWACAGADAS